MKRFVLVYSGPPAPPDATHEGWPEWFGRIGAALVDVGSPMKNGLVVRADGSTSEDAAPLRGYSIIQAEDRAGAVELLREHPLLGFSGEYTIELFELPRK